MECLPSLNVKARPAKDLGQEEAYVFRLYDYDMECDTKSLNMDAPQPRLGVSRGFRFAGPALPA
jgi:hypothetical protein